MNENEIGLERLFAGSLGAGLGFFRKEAIGLSGFDEPKDSRLCGIQRRVNGFSLSSIHKNAKAANDGNNLNFDLLLLDKVPSIFRAPPLRTKESF
ncbi:hypothetical protein KI614_08760 [Dechloromonas denitrificans]|uniref:hypothetical protein n=1 Tax=Dechloromonas denitrificans TaxID=281362 RepID=UPI001CF8A796|nr:hypothetical protein [Dechloromonas denitrificans]UCV10306.1 hypothetical protein KI614_08760 [Dechloromonas denitrificans]